MASIRELLDTVWNELGKANLADDLEIVEYIATLLLEQENAPHVVEGPKKPVIRYGVNEQPIRELLREAAKQAGGSAQLFDPHVLFHSTRVQKKEPGAYPTPRHIVAFMLQLLNPETGRSFADFSCGSGGFLVEAMKHFQAHSSARVVGIELSPSWARIARGNIALKNLAAYRAETANTAEKAFHAYSVQTTIYTGDAFRVRAPDGQLKEQVFDLIAMEPPSGVPIDPQQARKAIGDHLLLLEMRETESGYSSEVLFSWLMLSQLRPGGRGIIMVPPGLLYTDLPRSHSLLRQELVSSRRLRAVIQLNEDALAPFSYKMSCLLLVENSQREQWPWFFKIECDGYATEGSRDLTIQPDTNPDENDIPFVEAVIQQADRILYTISSISSATSPGLAIHWVRRSQGEPLGLVLYIQPGALLDKIERCAVNSGPQAGNYLLTTTILRDQILHHVITLPHKGRKYGMRRIQDEEEWKRRIYGQRMAPVIFENGLLPRQQIAITRDGWTIGYTQEWNRLSKDHYDLLPARYIPTTNKEERTGKKEERASRPPREEVAQPVPLEIVKEKPAVRQYSVKALPPQPAPFFYQTTLTNYFDPKQKAVYNRIQILVERAQGYAIYFTPEQLRLNDSFHVRQTLDLLETLGMIVRVQVRGQQYYRPVTELDKQSEQ